MAQENLSKKGSSSLTIRKKQIKTTLRINHTPVRIAKINKQMKHPAINARETMWMKVPSLPHSSLVGLQTDLASLVFHVENPQKLSKQQHQQPDTYYMIHQHHSWAYAQKTWHPTRLAMFVEQSCFSILNI